MFPLDILTQMTKEEKLERANIVLNRVGLENTNKKMPSEISGGMKKRVGIARAVVNRPPILLADEPTGNLDPLLSEEIMALFEQFNQVGVTVFIASHDQELIGRLPYRRITLKNGRLATD